MKTVLEVANALASGLLLSGADFWFVGSTFAGSVPGTEAAFWDASSIPPVEVFCPPVEVLSEGTSEGFSEGTSEVGSSRMEGGIILLDIVDGARVVDVRQFESET